jgi:hypothetical protein
VEILRKEPELVKVYERSCKRVGERTEDRHIKVDTLILKDDLCEPVDKPSDP